MTLTSSTHQCPHTVITSVFSRHVLSELRTIEIDETEFTITLTGRVSRYYLKLMAQETLKPLVGGREILNQLEVEDLTDG